MAGSETKALALHARVALVTGAGTGAGRRLAMAFAEAGATVAAADISPVNLETVVTGIVAAGGRAHAYIEDLAKKVAVQALLNRIEDALGRIDILVHHAAVTPKASVLEMDEWDWHRTVDVNLTAAFLLMQCGGRMMREHGGGVILTVTTLDPASQRFPYAVCVDALAALTRGAAAELAPHGIRVHMLGRGIRVADDVSPQAPSRLVDAAMHLSLHPDLNGVVLNVEDA